MRATRTTTASGLLAGLLLATGCGGDPAPRPAPLPPAAAAPTSAAPSPSATGLTTAELEAAARAYYAVLARALGTSDSALYATVVDRSCGCFTRLAPRLDARRAQGRRSTAKAVVREVVDPQVDGRDTGRVTVVFSEAPATVVDGSGAVVERTTGTPPRQELLFFARREGRLLVTRVEDFGEVAS